MLQCTTFSGAVVTLLLSAASLARGLDNGLALRPPLGWSTWQTCGNAACSHDACTEDEIKSVATAMMNNGMQVRGYNHVNLDDCWIASSRNATDQTITWDTGRFPTGIPALVDWLHTRGFKFGLYTSAGNVTCAHKPGSRGNYAKDAITFATWGVDYIKFDWCGDIKDEVWLGAQAHRDFAKAVNATGRAMYIEVVAGYFFLRAQISTVANSWRFCTDHHDVWKSTDAQILCRVDQANVTGQPGGWASMDFLHTGGAGCATGNHCAGQTDDEYKTEFVLWSLTQSPLVVDTDVRNMTQVMRTALLNPFLIPLHQTTATPPGTQLGYWAQCTEVLACSLWGRQVTRDATGGITQWAVALVNTGSKSHRITLDFAKLGWTLSTKAAVVDVWTNTSLPDAVGAWEADVPSHGTVVAFLRLIR